MTQAALIYDSAMLGIQQTLQLCRTDGRRWPGSPACCAAAASAGDRVVIYMPMIPEAAIAMLACARLGAVHSVVFGGFAAARNSPPASTTPRPRRW